MSQALQVQSVVFSLETQFVQGQPTTRSLHQSLSFVISAQMGPDQSQSYH